MATTHQSHPTNTPDETRDTAQASDRNQPRATDRATDTTSNANGTQTSAGQGTDLHDSPMMAHLLSALEDGQDIGHFGRLVFTMVARFFLPEDELIGLLAKQPNQSETDARALLLQVKARNYNPPKRERILQWQRMQDFPICPTPDEPGSCNVYDELRFPDEIYAQIGEFWIEEAEAQEHEAHDQSGA